MHGLFLCRQHTSAGNEVVLRCRIGLVHNVADAALLNTENEVPEMTTYWGFTYYLDAVNGWGHQAGL